MAFTIPNEADAFHADQAEPDKVDIDILVQGLKWEGVISGCAVTAQGTPDMTVAVASGQVQIAGARVTVSSGNVTVGTADATNPRFDLITVDNSGTKACTAGTAAASPVFPAVPANSVALAAVYIPATDTTIASNQIVDKRAFVLSHEATSIWVPDAPPASAGADDDEFADASAGVPSGWTEVDHGTVQTVTEDELGLSLLHPTHAGDSNAGIYKAIPAGDFSIMTKVSISGLSITNFVSAGLALWADATSSSGDLYNFVLQTDAASTTVNINLWNAYNSFNASVAARFLNDPDAAASGALPTSAYLRIRRTSTTYAFDVSSDGIGWLRMHSGTLSFAPTHYGPVANNTATGADVRARFAFFRYIASDVGITAALSGDRIKVLRH